MPVAGSELPDRSWLVEEVPVEGVVVLLAVVIVEELLDVGVLVLDVDGGEDVLGTDVELGDELDDEDEEEEEDEDWW